RPVLPAHKVELGLDSHVEGEPQRSGPIGRALEDDAATHWPGLAVVVEEAWSPGEVRSPRQADDSVEVGPHRELVVGWLLAETVECRPGEKLRAAHHFGEVIDRYALSLANTVHIRVGSEAIADALLA